MNTRNTLAFLSFWLLMQPEAEFGWLIKNWWTHSEYWIPSSENSAFVSTERHDLIFHLRTFIRNGILCQNRLEKTIELQSINFLVAVTIFVIFWNFSDKFKSKKNFFRRPKSVKLFKKAFVDSDIFWGDCTLENMNQY